MPGSKLYPCSWGENGTGFYRFTVLGSAEGERWQAGPRFSPPTTSSRFKPDRSLPGFLPMENLWPELACSEGLHGEQARAEVLGRQAPLAEEPAQKICGRVIPLLRIAVQATGNHVAVRIAPRRRERHHVIQAMGPAGDSAQ